MKGDELIPWLLDGDVAIQYQVYRDLLGQEKPALRNRIAKQGCGAAFLAWRHSNGHWGRGFYQPKWTSTHYTLLDLKHLAIPVSNKAIQESIRIILRDEKGDDGGINPARTIPNSDVCVNGMFLNYACYFAAEAADLRTIVDFLLDEHMADGGFNCYSNQRGAVHSSLHSTLSVMEGILEYDRNGYRYRLKELKNAWRASLEFILKHRLFRSSRSGKVIDNKMLLLSWPSRWRFDILRALDHFRDARVKYDSRMDDAIAVLLKKRRQDGSWPLQGRHAGATHFEMEQVGRPSRWNTLRALRVLNHFRIDPNLTP
jgi:hypothetical protein